MKMKKNQFRLIVFISLLIPFALTPHVAHAKTAAIESPTKLHAVIVQATASNLADDGVNLNDFGFLESEFPGTVNIVDSNTPHTPDSTRLEDFIDYIPGVQVGRLQAGLGTDVYIRGFSMGGLLYKDGLVDNRRYYVRDPSSLERVEIIKGRDSVLYGAGSPGGTVNFVIKKPEKTAKHSIEGSLGDPARLRVVLDSTGPIGSSERFYYRFIGMRQQAETGRKNVDDDRLMLMPSILYDNGKTQLRLLGEYSIQRRDFDFDTVLYHGRPVYNSSFAGPRNNSERVNKSIDLDFKHTLTPDWSLSMKANHYQVNRDELLSGFWYKQDEETLKGYYREIENDHSQTAFKAEIKGQHDFSHSTHFLTLGYERNLMKSIKTSRKFTDFVLDILNPVFDFPTPTRDQMSEYDYDEGDHSKAWYLQDKIYLGENLILRAGVRRSQFYRDFFRLGNLEILTDTWTTSSALGATYKKPESNWTYYVTRSQSFTPNIGRTKNNDYFDPKEGLLYEVGLRYADPKNKNDFKAGIYQLTQSNLTTTDPTDRDYQILAGERQIKGLEISATSRFSNQLNLSLGYSYMDGEITRNNDGLQGNIPGNLPTHSGSLNFSYTVADGIAKGLKLNLGMVAVSRRQVSDRNKFTVPGYTRFDFNARYAYSKKTEISFSVKNILDKDYIAAPIVEDVLVEGYPRRVLLSVMHQF